MDLKPARSDLSDSPGNMVRVTVTQRDGQVRGLEAREGEPLMHALSDADTGIEAICGGCLSCATCHIYVDGAPADALPPPEEAELDLIAGLLNARPSSRLSCQLEVTFDLSGLEITIAPPEA